MRLLRYLGLLLALLVASGDLEAQDARDSLVRIAPAMELPRIQRPGRSLVLPEPWRPRAVVDPLELSARWRLDLARRLAARERILLERALRPALTASEATALAAADLVPVDTAGLRAAATDLFGQYADLGVEMNARLEAKLDRTKNERCISSQFFSLANQCQGSFQPNFDFQFNVRTGGVVAERVHINVDYDSQREFDASNNISVYYEGKSDELISRLEVGNVTFQPPASRFITSGIPSGNYGMQATGQIGPMRFRSIIAQQKGNVSKDNVFTVGDRTLQSLDREIEDYQVEPRRFFFTVDPRRFAGYPNVDVLNGVQMRALSAALPDSVRPTRLFVYRLLIGGQPPNPHGPQFRILGDPNSRRGQIYEVLRENVDYYTDPSLLWIGLVRPLNLNNERLVVAYTVRLGGRDTTVVATGGTPDLEFTPTREQFANLLWDPQVRPGDDAFFREIRSIYRIGGEDVQRTTVSLKIVTGAASDQEKPLGGPSETYLQLFGLAQLGNSANFDVENRLWPRPGDPNVSIGAAANAKIIRDYFLVFPSLQPFARAGLAQPASNPANDAIYTTPGEYLYSPQHPQSFYRIRVRYSAEGGGDAGSLSLGAVQLRPNSERISIDGAMLRREVDYRIDYELGRVTFLRPDTLFPQPRQVSVRYEENPLFASAPTSIIGIASQFPFEQGELNFIAIAQNQRTTFTRPPLGYEPQSALIAGLSGNFDFEADGLTRALARIPGIRTSAPSRIRLEGEVAMSRPQANAAGQAYLESFEGEGGVSLSLGDPAWSLSSQPALGGRLASRIGGSATLDLARAATMAFQNNGLSRSGQTITFTFSQIDPLTTFAGNGIQQPEQLLWLTLYPLSIGGSYNDLKKDYQWRITGAPTGRRWRSIRTTLGPSGTDLSRAENLEFWTLIDTAQVRRRRNPTLVFDFGDPSENAVALAPTALRVTGTDSIYTGRRLVGFDSLNTERDPFSRAFNQERDDNGLPGDRVPTLQYTGPDSTGVLRNFPLCSRGDVRLNLLGDTKTNCTVRNGRLDEEDIDLDNVLNLDASQREQERLLRYVVDLGDRSNYARIGSCGPIQSDTVGGVPETNPLCWVLVRVPFGAPFDTVGGGPSIRRIRALRLTMISGEQQRDDGFNQLPLARLRLVGAPWLKRSDRVIRGIAGEEPGIGSVIATVIGTADRDSVSGLNYQSPPGVVEGADRRLTGLENEVIQINEKSMRLLAVNLDPLQRAETYFRFPEGQKNFMGYGELRIWARGRGPGWGPDGQLSFFVKLGRDANNFYMYRVAANSGNGQDAWLPEVRVDFQKFFALRAQLQNSFLQSLPDSIACSGVDSALIARSGLPAGQTIRRFAACKDGYMVYTIDPNVSPPNLAAVQELAVGMVRVDSVGGALPIMPSDTLELWIDDMRLTDVVNTPGYAGQAALSVAAGDIATMRVGFSHRDPNFRQLNEAPPFVSDNAFDIGTSVRLEKLLPQRLGIALPLSINQSRTASDPFFVSRSDIRGAGIDGLRTPKNTATAVSVSLRRITPMRSGILAPVLNNLSASAAFNTADTRSEFQTGKNSAFNAGVDLNVAAEARTAALPAWVARTIDALPDRLRGSEALQGLRKARLRWNPSSFRLTSSLAKNSDRRLSFTKPADAESDTGRVVRGLTNLWRTTGGFELRPFESLSARWDFNSLRDLRDYGDSTLTSSVASEERSRFAGLDVGLERERSMSATLNFAPVLTTWLRPRLDLSTGSSYQRDPNTRQLVQEGDSLSPFRLPRRASNSRLMTLAANIDLPRALRGWFRDSLITPRLAALLQPVDVSFTRTLSSAFDGAPFTPGWGYQLGLGDVESFRQQRMLLATSASENDNLVISSSLRLPYGLAMTGRMQQVGSRNWTRRQNNQQAVIEGEQVTLPDVSVRWSWRPVTPTAWITNLGLNARVLRTRQSSIAPSEVENSPADERVSRVTSLPISGTVTWNIIGGLTTTAGITQSLRVDSLPGSIAESRSQDISGDVGRSFKVPASWRLKSDLRTRLGYQQTHASSTVRNRGNAATSRLADNGRQSFNFNSDAEVAENLNFSMQASRIVNFDNNLNRRFSQMVVTAVFSIQFFAGEFK